MIRLPLNGMTMNLANWFSGVSDPSLGTVSGAPEAMLWPAVTLALSALVVIGSAAIALDWYVHSKLPGRVERAMSLRRLRRIVLFSAACAAAFHIVDIPWLVWRLYDAALLALVFYTWSFVLCMPAFRRVTARLARIDELEQSAERYREIAELLPHMVWTATDKGQVDFANQHWRQYTGDNRTWLEAVHPEERSAALSRWTRAIEARQPLTTEVRLGGAEGYRTFIVKATPLCHGDAVLWLGACADIEDQKQLAQQKEQQARRKSFFLNALSHDLRAPLHNVLLNAHLLKMSIRDEADLESVNMITENAVAAGDLVTRLLDFAKMGGEEQNAVEVVALEPMLQQLVRRFAPGTEQKGIYLRYQGECDARVRTDRQKLVRIVSNLIDNAIKYTSHGGIIVELLVLDGSISVRVSDTGIGIPPQNVPHLFDEFYQVNNHERDRSKGFGLGLAICKSLAGHLGADVRLVSTGPGGTCFEVVLPGVVVAIGDVGVDRGGRRDGAAGDGPDPAEAGLCGV